MMIKDHKAYFYAQNVVNDKIISGSYIKKVCQQFIDEVDNPDSKYKIDNNKLFLITGLTKLIKMATGFKAGSSAHDALGDFQWFFLINALCWVHKDQPDKRRYEKSVLLIARKSGKSFIVALLIVILMLTEPTFSEFYSVAPNRELSSIVKKRDHSND